jgi:hypothetical protein
VLSSRAFGSIVCVFSPWLVTVVILRWVRRSHRGRPRTGAVIKSAPVAIRMKLDQVGSGSRLAVIVVKEPHTSDRSTIGASLGFGPCRAVSRTDLGSPEITLCPSTHRCAPGILYVVVGTPGEIESSKSPVSHDARSGGAYYGRFSVWPAGGERVQALASSGSAAGSA